LSTTEEVLGGTDRWDEKWFRVRFRAVYRRRQSWILCDGDRDGDGADAVGWLQVADGPNRVTLDQLHLLPAYRGRGIGGGLLRELQHQARRQAKSVVLWVLKGNRAKSLYERLGFVVIRQDAYRLCMRWRPGAASPGPGTD